MTVFPVLRAGYGVLLVSAPGPMARRFAGHRPDDRTLVVTRVLGARHLAQAMVTAGEPGPVVLALGVEADLTHAASMVCLAAVDRSRRRAAIIDAVGASCFALTGAVLARRTPSTSTPSRGDNTPARLAACREALATQLARWALPRALRPVDSPSVALPVSD